MNELSSINKLKMKNALWRPWAISSRPQARTAAWFQKALLSSLNTVLLYHSPLDWNLVLNHKENGVVYLLKAAIFHSLQLWLLLVHTLPICPHLSQTRLSLSLTLFLLFQWSVSLSLPFLAPHQSVLELCVKLCKDVPSKWMFGVTNNQGVWRSSDSEIARE